MSRIIDDAFVNKIENLHIKGVLCMAYSACRFINMTIDMGYDIYKYKCYLPSDINVSMANNYILVLNDVYYAIDGIVSLDGYMNNIKPNRLTNYTGLNMFGLPNYDNGIKYIYGKGLIDNDGTKNYIRKPQILPSNINALFDSVSVISDAVLRLQYFLQVHGALKADNPSQSVTENMMTALLESIHNDLELIESSQIREL